MCTRGTSAQRASSDTAQLGIPWVLVTDPSVGSDSFDAALAPCVSTSTVRHIPAEDGWDDTAGAWASYGRRPQTKTMPS